MSDLKINRSDAVPPVEKPILGQGPGRRKPGEHAPYEPADRPANVVEKIQALYREQEILLRQVKDSPGLQFRIDEIESEINLLGQQS